jgi:hypothetical protein
LPRAVELGPDQLARRPVAVAAHLEASPLGVALKVDGHAYPEGVLWRADAFRFELGRVQEVEPEEEAVNQRVRARLLL